MAKDVTSFANAQGGVILIGVHTVKEIGLSADIINSVAPFEKTLVDTSQYRDILAHWVYPGLQRIKIEWVPSMRNPSVGLVIIAVGNHDQMWRPFLVTKTPKDNGKASSVILPPAPAAFDQL